MSPVFRLVIWLIVVGGITTLGLILGSRVLTEPGYVLLAYGSYTIEMSLWTACISAIVVGFVAWAIFGVGGFLGNVPSKLNSTWRSKQLKRSNARLTESALWLRRDNPERALLILEKDKNVIKPPALHWLLASEAARRLDRDTQSMTYLDTAEALMNKVPKIIASPPMPQTFKALIESLKKEWREDWVYKLEEVGEEDALSRLSTLNKLFQNKSLALEIVLARLAMESGLEAESQYHIERANKLNADHPLVICLGLEKQVGRIPQLELLRKSLL